LYKQCIWKPEAKAVDFEEILWKQVCRDILDIKCIWEPEAEAVELEEI
jgi:hypothetical protein